MKQKREIYIQDFLDKAKELGINKPDLKKCLDYANVTEQKIDKIISGILSVNGEIDLSKDDVYRLRISIDKVLGE